MQQILQTLQKFIGSSLCVFDFKSIDYPTEFQQHLITSYFEMNNLVKSYAHSDIIKQLHTSERIMETFISGLVYQMILQPTSPHFQSYMPSLRTQSWMHFSKLLLKLLADSFLWLKEQTRWGIVPLLTKLYYYRHLQVDHIILAVKTIDYLDMSQASLNYNNQILSFFYKILTQSPDKIFTGLLAKTLFYKLIRMLSLLVCIDDEAIREYKMRCMGLTQKIFQLQRERCLITGNSGTNILKELQKQQIFAPFLNHLKQAQENSQIRPQSPKSASLRLSCILPMQIQTTLLFVIRQNLSKIELKLQMDWIFQTGSQHNILLTIDILRYLLALTAEDLSIKECILLLQWLFYRVCSNNILFQIWKDELFFACFAQPCPFPAAPERAFHFLAYLLDADTDFGQTLLVYLLRHVNLSKKTEMLKDMLVKANQLHILNLNGLINHPRLRPRTKDQLLTVLGQKKSTQRIVEKEETIYYDPFSIANRKESQVSLDFSDQSHESEQYQNSQESPQPGHKELKDIQKMGKVRLEKMFVEDMGEVLNQLLQRPTIPIFIQFYKELVTVTKNFRVSGEHQMIDTFVGETSKIIYLLFQNQFQSYSQQPVKEYSVIFYLLNIVALQWRTNSFHGQLTKKLLKKIIQYFPTAQMAIWRNFLLFFKRGVVPVSKQIKDWLIPKDKADYAVSLLRQLGPLTREMCQNAELFKIAL